MHNPKKALIVEGGGSRGVFSFGVIDSFIQASFNPFDIHFGVSNGAVVQLWYLLAEADYNLDMMLFSASKDYVNYKNIFFNKYKYSKLLITAFQRRFRQELVNGIIDQECLFISNDLAKNLK